MNDRSHRQPQDSPTPADAVFSYARTLSGDTPINFVDHVGVAVHDTNRALPFYTDRLGLQVVGDEEAAEPGVRLTYLDAGNTFIQLVQPIREGPVTTFLQESGEGMHHLCLNVDHIEPTLHQLGTTARSGIFRGGRGRCACFLAERPNGVLLELTEREPRRD